jgi:hypothetical protein
MVERSVEQSVPPAGSGPHDFTMARLSMALMHASATAGGGEEKRSASLEGFIETDAMPMRNRFRSDPSEVAARPPSPLGEGGITLRLRRVWCNAPHITLEALV